MRYHFSSISRMGKKNTHRRRYKGGARKTARKGSKAASLNITSTGQMDSLKNLMKKNSVIMVFVYADWCGHCQTFKPEWKTLERLPERNVPMVSIRDDVFPKSPLKENIEVEGYPTVAIVNTAQNVTVNVPNREPESLKKLLVNNQNLTSPPPANMSMANMENELKNKNLPAKETASGTTIINVDANASPIKETTINEELGSMPNEIEPPAKEDSVVKAMEREGSRQLGGAKGHGRKNRGLFNSLKEYNMRN